MSALTIRFTRTQVCYLDFDTWYEHREFKSKEDALKKWEAMCEECTDCEVEETNDLGLEDIWEQVEEIENDVKDSD